MPVKYLSEAPSISRMPSSAFSDMSWRARSQRCARSSRVIGVASPLRDFRPAMEGGAFCSEHSVVLDGARTLDAIATPAVMLPASRNLRREIMNPPGGRNCSGHYRADIRYSPSIDGIGLSMRFLWRMECDLGR